MAHVNGKMADLTPPTKFPENAPAKRNIPYDCAFTETFNVLVGRDSNQQLFTVHHDIITNRSDFFEQARSPRWNPKKSVPVKLPHADPQIFDMYLHCVYHNVAPKFMGEYEEGDEDLSYGPRAEQRYEVFVDLYILADSLLDCTTTELVIKEIHEIRESESLPEAGVIKHAYRHTMAGCALRNALVEIYADAYSLPDGDFPNAFLRSVVEKQMCLRYG